MRQKRLGMFLSMVVTVLLAGVTAHAASLKIGYVDYSQLLKEAPQSQASSQLLKQQFGAQRKKIMVKQKEVKKLQSKLQNDSDRMSSLEQASLQQKLQALQQELSQQQSNYQSSLNLRRNELLSNLQQLISKEVKTYAKQNHYDLVLGDGVFYASSGVDITNAILQKLKQAYANAHHAATKPKPKSH